MFNPLNVVSMLLFLLLYKCVFGMVYVRGKGASFPNEVYKEWRPAYHLHRRTYVDLEMTYSAIGSGNGKAAIMENIDIEYAGTDSLLSNDTTTTHPDLILFPIMAGAVVLGYNLPEIGDRLVLTRQSIVGIYNGTYTWWNDTVFTQSNPGMTLPKKRIIVIARRDKSGTTSMFTEAISAFSPEWKTQYGIFSRGVDSEGVSSDWNPDAISEYGQHNRGVSGFILSYEYSIGYLSVADAVEAGILTAVLLNKADQPVNASSASIQSAMDYFSERNQSLTFSLADAGSADAYPIAGFTHIVMYKTQMENCASAKELVRYLDWVMTQEDQRQTCDRLGMSALSPSMVERVRSDVLKQVLCKGLNVWEMVQRDIAAENQQEQTWIIPLAVSIPIVALGMIGLSSYIIIQRIRIQKMIDNDEWHIPIEDILFFLDGKNKSSVTSRIADRVSIKSSLSVQHSPDDDGLIKQILQWPGRYKSNQIGIRLIELKELSQLTRQTKQQLLWMKRKLSHNNIVRMFGLTEVDTSRYVIGDYCAKGHISSVVQDNKFNLSNDFKCALAGDVANGLQYLHSNEIVHGHLRSAVCLIDARWQVKICDWEFNKLISLQTPTVSPIRTIRNNLEQELDIKAIAFQNFWASPEAIRSDFKLLPTKDTDVYSFAIILQEIFTREDPYAEHADTMTPMEVIRAITLNNLRPEHSEDTPMNIRQLMEICWSDNPISRPSFEQILKLMKRANPVRKTVIDSMMSTLEEYIVHLEERVEEKNTELTEANNTLETTLSGLMPVFVAKQISKGNSVRPMYFPSLAVAILDISYTATDIPDLDPHDIMVFINALCLEVDVIAKKYSVFTESVSGCSLALVHGLEAATTEVESMCLAMVNLSLDILSHEDLPKRTQSPQNGFEIRLGLHTDPAVTGLSGTNTPVYVVFGSCTDVAHALARSASARCLHVSQGVWRAVKHNKHLTGNIAGELSVKEKKYVTYTITRTVDNIKNATSEDSSLAGETNAHQLSQIVQHGAEDRIPNGTCQTGPAAHADLSDMLVQTVISKECEQDLPNITVTTVMVPVKNHPMALEENIRSRSRRHHKHGSKDCCHRAGTRVVGTQWPDTANKDTLALPISKEFVPVKSKWKRKFFNNDIYPNS